MEGSYEYELRQDDEVVATGRMQLEQPPSTGDTLTLGSQLVEIIEIVPLAGRQRLILAPRRG